MFLVQVTNRELWQNALQTRGYRMCADELSWGDGKKLSPEMVEGESRPATPDSNKRSSSGSAAGTNSTVRQLAAAILQVKFGLITKAIILGEIQKKKLLYLATYDTIFNNI